MMDGVHKSIQHPIIKHKKIIPECALREKSIWRIEMSGAWDHKTHMDKLWWIKTFLKQHEKWGIKARKCLYEGVIVPTALYGTEAWGLRSAERMKVNVLEIKCLRSLVGVSPMDRVRNEEVRRRAGIERELASRADQRVYWDGLGMWKEWMSTVWPEGCWWRT